MFQFHFVSFVISIYLLVLQPFMIECRPRSQRIVVHGHEWTVPNAPGWDDVLQQAEALRQRLFSSCATGRECRLAAEKIRQFFLKHPVSSKYYDGSLENYSPPRETTSIFKWG